MVTFPTRRGAGNINITNPVDYFTGKRTEMLDIINNTEQIINRLLAANSKPNDKNAVISNVDTLKKLLKEVDNTFKTYFIELYNFATNRKISLPSSGFTTPNNPSKLNYHLSRVKQGDKRFHRLPKVSEMGGILAQLTKLIETNENTAENKRNANPDVATKIRLHLLKAVLNRTKNRLGGNNKGSKSD